MACHGYSFSCCSDFYHKKKGYNARVHLTKSRGLIDISFLVILNQLSYSLAFFSLNEVALSNEFKLPIKLKEGQVLDHWKESNYGTFLSVR